MVELSRRSWDSAGRPASPRHGSKDRYSRNTKVDLHISVEPLIMLALVAGDISFCSFSRLPISYFHCDHQYQVLASRSGALQQ